MNWLIEIDDAVLRCVDGALQWCWRAAGISQSAVRTTALAVYVVLALVDSFLLFGRLSVGSAAALAFVLAVFSRANPTVAGEAGRGLKATIRKRPSFRTIRFMQAVLVLVTIVESVREHDVVGVVAMMVFEVLILVGDGLPPTGPRPPKRPAPAWAAKLVGAAA